MRTTLALNGLTRTAESLVRKKSSECKEIYKLTSSKVALACTCFFFSNNLVGVLLLFILSCTSLCYLLYILFKTLQRLCENQCIELIS